MPVVSANLYRGRVPSTDLAALLAELRPDVGAFQELTPELGLVVADHFEHGVLFPKEGSSGLGIGACRPVRSERLDLPRRRPATVATLDPDTWPNLGRTIKVLNVHMTHPMVFPPWRSLPERSHQLSRIIEHADGHDAMVLGDLNDELPAGRHIGGSTEQWEMRHRWPRQPVAIEPTRHGACARLAGRCCVSTMSWFAESESTTSSRSPSPVPTTASSLPTSTSAPRGDATEVVGLRSVLSLVHPS